MNVQVENELGLAGDILVVDDNVQNLMAVEVALGDLGERLIKAGSGRDALRHLLHADVALIILDVHMPGLDGFETARLIRARQRSKDVPIIFITAYDRDDRDVLEAYQLGAVDFLFKPIVPEVLRAKASVFVSLKRRTDEVARQAVLLREHQRKEHERELAEERRRWEQESLRRRMEEERATAEVLRAKNEQLAETLAEKARVEQALRRINERLEEADRKKDEFLALLGHELRNPLTPLTSGLEILRSKDIQDPQVLRIRELMERQVSQLVRLVDDLLDVSRISSGKIELRTGPVDLLEIVREACSACRALAEQKDHTLTVRVDGAPLRVLGDPARLTQIVSNLVHNAVRYTDPSGRIDVSCTKRGEEALLRVSDDGRGIPPNLRDRIFEMFVQHTPLDEGLGLGLTLVKRLAELHGGRVEVESPGEGLGSTFSVAIPLTTQQSPVEPAAPEPAEAPSLRIVLIEDNADVRASLGALLEALGHVVHDAPDGLEGLELLSRVQPDVAIVDIGLPGLDGYAVAKQLRDRVQEPRPILVALTGFGQECDRQRARAAGFDHHLIKPPSLEALVSILQTARTDHARDANQQRNTGTKDAGRLR